MVANLTKHSLSVGCWNIDGAHHGASRICKLDLPDVCSVLSQFDILCLVETHCRPDDFLSLPGYKFIESKRPKLALAGRYSGGLAIGFKSFLSDGIEILPIVSTECVWIKLRKRFFNLERDIYLACIYVAPQDSPYFQQQDSVFDLIEGDVAKYSKDGDCLLCGDFNARTHTLDDFCHNFVPPDSSDIF